MSLQIALLRGVNLGKRQVKMDELRAVCEAAGCTDVRSLIASGNLVLRSKLRGAKLEAKLEKAIEQGLGLESDVFVRTAAEIAAVVAGNPFKAFSKDKPTFLVVHFLRDLLTAAEKTALMDNDGPEETKLGKGCLYTTFPNGQAASKLKRPSHGTARNWNTVTKLAAMAAGE